LRGEIADADAVVLSEKGEVHMFAPADCATLIIEFIEDDTIKYISAHIGLRSFFPKSGNSIIDIICKRLGKDKIKSAKGYIDFCISPSRLTRNTNFPGQEIYNTSIRDKMRELGQLNSTDQTEFAIYLKKMTADMFKEKSITVSVGNNNTDDFNKFWSYRDNQARNDGVDGRNLVVVVKR
jgi:copper oxidase (laccase) domain-containing protein